jgi:hypothetical protein
MKWEYPRLPNTKGQILYDPIEFLRPEQRLQTLQLLGYEPCMGSYVIHDS